MSNTILKSVWFLTDGVEPEALVRISMMLKREGFAPRERLQADKLTILMRGVAAKGGMIMTHDATKVQAADTTKRGANEDEGRNLPATVKLPHWGEDIILNSPALRDRKPAAALTYCEVLTLTREELDRVLDGDPTEHTTGFPESKKHIRRAAVYMAVRRSFATVADYVTDHFGDDFAMGASAQPVAKCSESPRAGMAAKVAQGINDMYACSSGLVAKGGGSSVGGGDMAEVMELLQQQGKVLQTLAEAYTGVADRVAENNLYA